VATGVLVPCPFADKTNTLTTKFFQGATLIHRDVVEAALSLSLKVIVAIVTSETQVALPLTKPQEFLELENLLCIPCWDRMEA
jgi:hypothetical protein